MEVSLDLPTFLGTVAACIIMVMGMTGKKIPGILWLFLTAATIYFAWAYSQYPFKLY